MGCDISMDAAGQRCRVSGRPVRLAHDEDATPRGSAPRVKGSARMRNVGETSRNLRGYTADHTLSAKGPRPNAQYAARSTRWFSACRIRAAVCRALGGSVFSAPGADPGPAGLQHAATAG